MTVLRWIAFAPLAFGASLAAGMVGNVTGQFVGQPFGGGSLFGWTLSGLCSGFAFLWVGARVAPHVTSPVKWSLLGLIALIGGMSVLGALIDPSGLDASWVGGAMMMVVAASFFKSPPIELPGTGERQSKWKVSTASCAGDSSKAQDEEEEESANRGPALMGRAVQGIGFLAWLVFGLWGFVIALVIVNDVAGFWGVVLGFFVAPLTCLAAPLYALIAWGTWTPFLILYGGTFAGLALMGIGSAASE